MNPTWPGVSQIFSSVKHLLCHLNDFYPRCIRVSNLEDAKDEWIGRINSANESLRVMVRGANPVFSLGDSSGISAIGDT